MDTLCHMIGPPIPVSSGSVRCHGKAQVLGIQGFRGSGFGGEGHYTSEHHSYYDDMRMVIGG